MIGIRVSSIDIFSDVKYHDPETDEPGAKKPLLHIEPRFQMDDDMKKKLRDDDCGLATILQPSEMTEFESALHDAAKHNDIPKIKTLLTQKYPERVQVNCRNNFDRTALHWAAAMGHCEAIEVLVSLGADIDARDKYGMWPLLWTAWFGHLEALKTFVNLGAMKSVSNKQGMDIIHCAAQNNHVNILIYVFESLEGLNINSVDKNKQTSLHLAAEAGNIQVVDILIQKKCKISEMDKVGNTPLHLAAKEGKSDVTERLLDAGAQTEDRNEDGKTALHLASENGHHETVVILLKHDASVNVETVKEMTPLHLAAMNGCTAVAERLVDEGSELNSKNCQGNTPLHLSAIYNHPEVASKLVDAHCELDLKNQRFQTPLHIGVESGYGDLVEVLLQARANILAKDKNGRTPLHMAARGSFTGIVDMLIQADRIRMTEECLAKDGYAQDQPDKAEAAGQPLQLRHPTHPHSHQMKAVLFKIATKHFKPSDWKKLAMYWGFTTEHIKTIEHEYSGRLGYKEHGFRMMMIWLVGVKPDETPLRVLFEALVVTGKKRLAEQIRREVNKQAEKTGGRACTIS